MYSALNIEAFDGRCDMTVRQHLNRCFQLRVTLSQNLIQLYRVHSRFLKLCKGAASVNAFMLMHIANQQHPIIPMKTRKELVHLPCGRKRGLIQYVKTFFSCIGPFTSG